MTDQSDAGIAVRRRVAAAGAPHRPAGSQGPRRPPPPIRRRKRRYILTTDQSEAGNAGIFSRRTNQTQEAQ
eukprot:6064470-Pyramimonas_sp.AAC.1